MACLTRRIWLCLTVAIAASCADRTALDQRAESAPAQRLVGTWVVSFHMDRSLMPTMDTVSVPQDVRGQLAFLANRWLDRAYPQIETPTDYGTYDIDFAPFGFDPRVTGQPPTAVAGWLAHDSVEIILEPEQTQMAVTMRGKLDGDSISGIWQVSVSRTSGGGGRFMMSRHRE